MAPRDAADGDGSGATRRRLLGGVATAAVGLLAGCSVALGDPETATVRRRFDAGDVSRLRVGADGDATVRRADGDRVEVEVTKRAYGGTDPSDLELRSSAEGETLRLRTHVPTVVGIGGGDVDVDVRVPASVRVERVESDAGTVSLDGVAGDATVAATAGDVSVRDVRGDVDVDAANGDVTTTDTQGFVAAETENGDVAVTSPDGVGDLGSVDGDVEADVPALRGEPTLATTNGDVEVALGADLDAAVEATTENGAVEGVDALDDVDAASGTRLAGAVGDGGPELRLETTNGDVTVRRER